ncbi:MAG: hypothetical protein ACRESR_10975, partial [Gammaproteobacteria bacterium]
VIARLQKADTRLKDLQRQNKSLSKAAAAIGNKRSRLHGNLTDHNLQAGKLQVESASYNAQCSSESSSMTQLILCNSKRRELLEEIDKINAKNKSLTIRQQALKKAILQYNAAVTTFNQGIPGALKEREEAFAAEAAWLNSALKLISSPQLLPYVPQLEPAGCRSAKSLLLSATVMKKMAKQMLDCLHKFAETRLAG